MESEQEKLHVVTEDLGDKKKKDAKMQRVSPILRRTLSGSVLNESEESGSPLPSDPLLMFSRLLDERLYDPYYRSKATEFEMEISTAMTNRKYFAGIENILRRTKIISFLACPIFLGVFIKKLSSRPPPILVCIYGVISLDCLRISYNCYSRNYCAIGLRKLGTDGNLIKIGSTMFER